MGSISVSGLGTFAVPDSFAVLPADQQAAAVDEMVSQARGAGHGLQPSPSSPGLLDRLGGELGRGILGGVTGVADTAQAAARGIDWLTKKAGLDLGPIDDLDHKIDNADLDVPVAKEEDRQGLYAPQALSGKLVQGAASGITGAALGGAGSKLGLLSGAASGTATQGAQAVGADPTTAGIVGLVAGVGVPGTLAARATASEGIKNALANRAAGDLTDDDAKNIVQFNSAISDRQAADPKTSVFQAASGYKKDLASVLGQYRKVAGQAGYVDDLGSKDLAAAIGQANSHTSAPSSVAGSALPQVQALNLPDYHQDAVEGALGQLNTTSGQQFFKNATGPVSSALKTVGGTLSAVPFLGRAGDVASSLASKVGQPVDYLLGLQQTPFQRALRAAQARVSASGLDASANPLVDMRSAVSDAQGDIADQASAARDADAAATVAKQTDKAWQANAASKNAAEDAWTKALAQKAKQDAAGTPDLLSTALWKAAEDAAPPNLAAVTNSQTRGFQAEQTGFARRDTQEGAAATASAVRGTNLREAAGAWLERQRIAQFKRDNPGVPVTGAAALDASGPSEVFDATGGRFGNPAGTTPPMNGFRSPSDVAPEGASTAPVGSAQRGAQTPAPVPQVGPQTPAAPAYGPFPVGPASGGLIQPATGGKALATIMHRQTFGGAAPAPDELTSAIDDIAADGLVHPMEADAAHAGQNISPAFALTIAHRVQNARVAAPVTGQAAQQASSEVAGLTGSPPFGTDASGAPIRNPTAYAGARNAYAAHAGQMIALATDPAEKQALSQIATAPKTADKAAIRDVYSALKPGADLSRFTPQLMTGQP